jgi:hypothetical protein
VADDGEPSGKPTDALDAGAKALELELRLKLELDVLLEFGLVSEPEPELDVEPKLDAESGCGRFDSDDRLAAAPGWLVLDGELDAW